MKRLFLILIFLISPVTAICQITGTVHSAKDSVALEGVSVYFDGTTIGTVTNSRGEFTLDRTAETAPLVISFLGYEDLILSPLQKEEKTGVLFLQEKAEELAEVFIEPDTWSRERKLRTFIREFFGNTPAALKCKIKNPEVLELHYSESRKELTAYTREPLKIINRHLGYKINYSLDSFRAGFSTGSTGLSLVTSVSYAGTSFFENLRDKPSKKHVRNRKNSYLGSSLHFMRSLSLKELEENGFHTYYKGFRTPPYEHFKIEKEGGLVRVELIPEKLSILYSGIEQSEFLPLSPLYIDNWGNHSPPLSLVFGGEMAGQRIAHLLPLDYHPDH